ncbi:MarR family winged helix-turn-helix transcriptional regulator [Anaeromusa sp.]|jgi:MarR family transcriptional regulator for hemolysin|uniref:MarR family winged helix-turn-helix transcriptional regulator n=1 Tax=Anaeromusa sp. TaxID=1872520 RepID=UPI00260CA96E|nr:MarR family transcriptional regulator [Anaeromusa sp.]MDD3158264.1 MarR family transcriptional regulator [Anaeromusa sp.]MEA4834006.1 MarR family transcriptional regulator [Anaeromusa sp.]NCB77185.1 MarR family transcriptional regulator [Negativicutes bacterium]
MDLHGIFHGLHQAVRGIDKGVNQVLAPYGISASEWAVLTSLDKWGELTQKALAEYMHLEAAAISKSVAKLEAKGLVVRKEGLDRRERKVALAAKAKQAYACWMECTGRHRQAVLADFTAEELQALLQALQRLQQNADQWKENEVATHEQE